MDILDGVLGEAPEAVTTPDIQAGEAQEPSTGPVRGPDGKFAASQPEPQPDTAPIAQPVAEPIMAAAAVPEPAKPEPGYVPITALLDTRDKLRASEERLRVLEAQAHAQAQQAQQYAPPPMAPPSVFEDEAAYHEYMQNQVQHVAINTRLEFSEQLARDKHGDEVVSAAQQWALQRFQQTPSFHDEVLAQRNPYEYVVGLHKREAALARLDPAQLDQFLAWQAAGGNASQAQHIPTAPAVVIPKSPTPSLATASSAGGVSHVPMGPGQAFDQTFK